MRTWVRRLNVSCDADKTVAFFRCKWDFFCQFHNKRFVRFLTLAWEGSKFCCRNFHSTYIRTVVQLLLNCLVLSGLYNGKRSRCLETDIIQKLLKLYVFSFLDRAVFSLYFLILPRVTLLGCLIQNEAIYAMASIITPPYSHSRLCVN